MIQKHPTGVVPSAFVLWAGIAQPDDRLRHLRAGGLGLVGLALLDDFRLGADDFGRGRDLGTARDHGDHRESAIVHELTLGQGEVAHVHGMPEREVRDIDVDVLGDVGRQDLDADPVQVVVEDAALIAQVFGLEKNKPEELMSKFLDSFKLMGNTPP